MKQLSKLDSQGQKVHIFISTEIYVNKKYITFEKPFHLTNICKLHVCPIQLWHSKPDILYVLFPFVIL